MSGRLVYEAEYELPSGNLSELKQLIQKIFEEQEGFVRTNQSNPLSPDFAANLEYAKNFRRFELPFRMKVKKAFNSLSHREEQNYHYYETLKRNKPETVYSVQVSIKTLGKDSSEVMVRTEPCAIHQESQLGWSTDRLDDSSIWRIHDRQQTFIENYFNPMASETIKEPAPVAGYRLRLSTDLKEQLPDRAMSDFEEANRCFAINCNQAAMAMIARGFEVALAKKLSEDSGEGRIIYSTSQDGTKRYESLGSLIKYAEEDYDISNRLKKNDINWSRIASVHFSDGYTVREKKVENVFSYIEDYLSEIYL
jgi:hypothetical protein